MMHGTINIKCRRVLIKYVFNISCAFGWHTEEVFEEQESTECKTLK
jgi:hypothetical protein